MAFWLLARHLPFGPFRLSRQAAHLRGLSHLRAWLSCKCISGGHIACDGARGIAWIARCLNAGLAISVSRPLHPPTHRGLLLLVFRRARARAWFWVLDARLHPSSGYRHRAIQAMPLAGNPPATPLRFSPEGAGCLAACSTLFICSRHLLGCSSVAWLAGGRAGKQAA